MVVLLGFFFLVLGLAGTLPGKSETGEVRATNCVLGKGVPELVTELKAEGESPSLADSEPPPGSWHKLHPAPIPEGL